MINQKLISLAQHMWDIRTSLQGDRMDRSSLEKTIGELEEIRTGIAMTQAINETEQKLLPALDTLLKAAEEEVLCRLSDLPLTLPDSFYRDPYSLRSTM